MSEDQHHQQQSSPKERKSIHDIRNQDLVSRFLAATPPYLYSAPVGPNNFFFSDMLRSLVQARNNENARNIQLQQAALGRRPRKRPWSQHRPYYEHIKERKELIAEEKPPPPPEKPLELTNKQLFPISAKYPKADHHRDDIPEKLIPKVGQHNSGTENKVAQEFDSNLQNENPPNLQEPPAASLPPSDLVLPPPPPVWYPPIYPPYGIDPLHFFIDLRVSGHIYDRKKDNASPGVNSDNNNVTNADPDGIGKHRHGSAFTVPPPRNDSSKPNSTTVDLEKMNNGYKYYDLSTDAKENHLNSKNTNYVLQNLPRIYTHMNSRDSDNDMDNKSDPDVDDLTEDNLDKENSNHIDVEVIENVRSRSSETRSSNSTSDELQSGEIHQID